MAESGVTIIDAGKTVTVPGRVAGGRVRVPPPMRGIDPMGPQFRQMLQEWAGGGRPYYRPLPD